MERRLVENERNALRRRLKVAPEKQQKGNLVGKRLDGILLDVEACPAAKRTLWKVLEPVRIREMKDRPPVLERREGAQFRIAASAMRIGLAVARLGQGKRLVRETLPRYFGHPVVRREKQIPVRNAAHLVRTLATPLARTVCMNLHVVVCIRPGKRDGDIVRRVVLVRKRSLETKLADEK